MRAKGRTVFLAAMAIGMALVLAIGLVACCRFGVHNLFIRQPEGRVGQVVWEERGPTTGSENGYTPQGIAWVKGRLLFANSWKDTLSRVYEIDPADMKVARWFDMPPEAVHTSGLSWDGSYLWGVDYISNRAYRIDLEPSLASGTAVVVGSFPTGLEGTSACAVVAWEGESLLAISDFMRTRRTYFVRYEEALATGAALAAVEFSYENEGFSQGLEFAEGNLFETENKWRSAVINRLDIGRLRETGKARDSIVKQYPAPDRGVEDLVLGGGYMWTSDEHVFRFFRGKLE